MRKMKKQFCAMLAMVMVLAMASSVLAANITINGGATNSVYSAWRLLDATNAVDENGDGTDKFAYTVNSKYEVLLKEVITEQKQAVAEEGVTVTVTSEEIVPYIQTLDEVDGIRTFADAVYAKIKANNIAADKTSENGVFAGVEQGYYLIAETTLGSIDGDGESTDDESTADTYSLVMLDTAGEDDITVNTKESVPELIKKVKEKNDSTGVETGWQDAADYDIGDTVPFQLTGTLPSNYDSYETYTYVFHDEMSEGLTLNKDSIKVYVVNEGAAPVEISSEQYEVVTKGLTDNCTFEVRFDDLKQVDGVTKDSQIVVEFTATLNEYAQIGAPGNPNKAKLEYSNNPYGDGEETSKTPEDQVIVFTYTLVVNKVDGEKNNPLTGAGFTLYKWDAAAEDWVPVGEEVKGEELTTFTFTGLDAGNYKLVETTVPVGYNKAADIEFTITATYETEAVEPKLLTLTVEPAESFTVNMTDGVVETTIINNAGVELPETGGIGTTMFYLVGSILVIGAVVVMVTKKRMSVL